MVRLVVMHKYSPRLLRLKMSYKLPACRIKLSLTRAIARNPADSAALSPRVAKGPNICAKTDNTYCGPTLIQFCHHVFEINKTQK